MVGIKRFFDNWEYIFSMDIDLIFFQCCSYRVYLFYLGKYCKYLGISYQLLIYDYIEGELFFNEIIGYLIILVSYYVWLFDSYLQRIL